MASLKYLSPADGNLMTVTLGSGYTAASGSMALTAGHGARLPSTGDFWLMTTSGTRRVFKVTARSTDTLTVTAAQDGTSDANLDAGAELKWTLDVSAVEQLQSERNRVLTVAQFDALAAGEYRNGDRIVLSDSLYEVVRDSGAWTYLYKGQRVVRPPSSGWSWDNQASSTIDSASGFEYLSKPKAGSGSLTVRHRAPPSTPYSVKALLLFDAFGAPPGISGTKQDAGFGICFRDSDGSIADLRFTHDSSGLGITTSKWTNSTTFAATLLIYQTTSVNSSLQLSNPKWFGLRDDGSNVLFYWSIDGLGTPGVSGHWKLFDTQTYAAAGMGASPNGIGFYAYGNGNAIELGLVSWDVI